MDEKERIISRDGYQPDKRRPIEVHPFLKAVGLVVLSLAGAYIIGGLVVYILVSLFIV